MIIGPIAGALVVVGVKFFDRIRADDPVGRHQSTSSTAFSARCAWACLPRRIGFLAAATPRKRPGLFYGGGSEQFFDQLIGVLACGAYVVVVAAVAWTVLKATVGIRVSAAEEEAKAWTSVNTATKRITASSSPEKQPNGGRCSS